MRITIDLASIQITRVIVERTLPYAIVGYLVLRDDGAVHAEKEAWFWKQLPQMEEGEEMPENWYSMSGQRQMILGSLFADLGTEITTREFAEEP